MMRSMISKQVDSVISFGVLILCLIVSDMCWRSSIPIAYKILIGAFSVVIVFALLISQPKDIVVEVERKNE